MNKEEVRLLEARLGELADYYSAKKPSAAALAVWKDVLEGVRWEDIAAVLTDWPKHKRQFPVGDEVRKLAGERVSKRLEDESRRNNETAPTIEGLMRSSKDTPNGRAFKRMWDSVCRRKTVESPRQWCKNVLESQKAEDSLKRFAEASIEQMETETEEAAKIAARMEWVELHKRISRGLT